MCIMSSLEECCLFVWLSALKSVHTLHDCLQGFVFPIPIGYWKGGTCLLSVSGRIMGQMGQRKPSKDVPELRRWNRPGNSF